MPNPAGNSRRTPAAVARERYHAVLDRFHHWCEHNGRSFCLELTGFCQRAMGEEPSSHLEPTNDRRELAVTPPPPPAPLPCKRTALPEQLRPARQWAHAVRNDRGESFPSISAAARSIGEPIPTFRHYVGSGRPIGGTCWHYAEAESGKERAA